MATFQIAKLVATLVLDDKGFKDKANQNKSSSESLFNTLKQGAVVVGSLAAAFAVAKKAFDMGKEGAQILMMRERFNNWSEAIGTTSDLLLKDLREATHGMYSDSELVAKGTDLMSLGLAKTHDQVVRMSTVAGALNMDMNELVLTLTNKTMKRFDQLSVSTDGFKERLKELEKTMGDDAFTEAFLQQAERQIEITGDAAYTAAGQFAIFEAEVKNSTDALKVQVAQALLPVIKAYNENAEAQKKILHAVKIVNPELYRQAEISHLITPEMRELADAYYNAIGYQDSWARAIQNTNSALEAANDPLTTYGFRNQEIVSVLGGVISENQRYAQTTEELRQKYVELNEEKQKMLKQGYSPEGKAIQEINEKILANGEAMQENQEQHKKWVNAKIGDLLLMRLSQDDLTDAELGYYVNFLVQTDQMSQEDAELATDIVAGADARIAAWEAEQGELEGVDSKMYQVLTRYQRAKNQSMIPIVFDVFIHVYGDFPKVPEFAGQGGIVSPIDPTKQVKKKQAKGGRATGGAVMAGHAYDVVELNKPEMFVPQETGRVDPMNNKPVIARIPREDMRDLARIITEEMAKAYG